jgi:hypothetical protein
MATRFGFVYEITCPDGKIVQVDNLSAFARERNIEPPTLFNSIRLGKPAVGYIVKKLSGGSHRRKYIVTEPDGRRFQIDNLAEYCRTEGLYTGALLSVAKGKIESYIGYKLEFADLAERTPYFLVKTPEGKQKKTRDLTELCKEYGLSLRHVRRVIAGKQKSHRNYQVFRVA